MKPFPVKYFNNHVSWFPYYPKPQSSLSVSTELCVLCRSLSAGAGGWEYAKNYSWVGFPDGKENIVDFL